MLRKVLSLLLCWVALLPKQVCTCAWAHELTDLVSAPTRDCEQHHDDSHQHDETPNPSEPNQPIHEHDPGCLALDPLQFAITLKATSAGVDAVPVALLPEATCFAFDSTSIAFGLFTSTPRPPRAPIQVIQCSFQI